MKNTLITVSADALPRCLTMISIIAHITPNASIAGSWLLRPISMPMPTPVSALWPSASEKNAIRPDTAIVPISAIAGAISTIATSASRINPY